MEKYENHITVDENMEGDDIFINGKIVDDFNTLDKKIYFETIFMYYIYIIIIIILLLYFERVKKESKSERGWVRG